MAYLDLILLCIEIQQVLTILYLYIKYNLYIIISDKFNNLLQER